MNIGIIGFGLMGQQRAADVRRTKGHKIVSVCDVDLKNAGRLQKEIDCRLVTKWEEMVSDKDIDIVIVAVPHHLSSEITISALNAGKHVLCEKPIGRSLSEARSVVKSASENLTPGLSLRSSYSTSSPVSSSSR